MKSFTEFVGSSQINFTPAPKVMNKVIIKEALEPHHEYEADAWDHHALVTQETSEQISKAMTHSPHHAVLDINRGDTYADPDVEEHLHKHGYKISDYRAGTASTKKTVGDPSRGIPLQEKTVEEGIGKVLSRTKAPEHVTKAFANDPARSSTKDTSHKIVVSTHPYAIAGMSTGTHWESCMNMDSGINRHYLPRESENGTHVAYLTKHDDPGIKNGIPEEPLGRIALKAYHSTDDDGETHTVYRPSTNSYGSVGDDFTSSVHKWADAAYPAKQGHTYHRNSDSYDDYDNDEFYEPSKQEVSDHLTGKSTMYALPNISSTVLHSGIDHAMKSAGDDQTLKNTIARNASQGTTLNPQYANRLMASADSLDAINSMAIMHGDKLSTANIEKYRMYHAFAGKPANGLPTKIVMNKRLPDAALDSLSPSLYEHAHPSKIKEKHIDKIVDSYVKNESGSSYPLAKFADRLSDKNIHQVIDNAISRGGYNLPNGIYKNAKQEHYAKIEENLHKIDASSRRVFLQNTPTLSDKTITGLSRENLDTLSTNKNLDDNTKTMMVPRIINAMKVIPGDGMRAHIPNIGARMNKHFTDDHLDDLVEHHKAHHPDISIPIDDHDLNDRYMDRIAHHFENHSQTDSSGHEDGGEGHYNAGERMLDMHSRQLHHMLTVDNKPDTLERAENHVNGMKVLANEDINHSAWGHEMNQHHEVTDRIDAIRDQADEHDNYW